MSNDDGLIDNNNNYIFNHNANSSNDKILNFFSVIKQHVFEVFHLCLKYENLSLSGVIVIMIFEISQDLFFCFNQLFKHTWVIQSYEGVYNYIHKFLSIFIFVPFFKESTYSLFIVIFIVCFIIVLLLLIIFVLLAYDINRKKAVPLYPVFMFNILAQYFNSVLFLPFTQVFLPFFHCDSFFSYHSDLYHKDKNFCSSAQGVILTTFAAIGMVLTAIFSFLFALLYFDMKLQKGHYQWRLSPVLHLSILIGKFFVAICFEVVDKTTELTLTNKMLISGFLFFAMIVLSYIILIRRTLFFSLITHKIYKVKILILLITTGIIFTDIVLIKFGTESIHCFYQIWCMSIFAIVIYQIFIDNNYIDVLSQHINEVTSPSKASDILIVFFQIFTKRNVNRKYDTILKGFILTHENYCTDADCPLKIYNSNLKKKHLMEVEEQNRLLLNYINEMFIRFLTKFPNDVQIRILYSYFTFEFLKKINVSKLNILTAFNSSPSFSQSFSLFRLLKFIHEDYLNLDDDIFTVDIASTIIYDSYYKQFQDTIFKIGFSYLDFWNNFIQEEINLKRIKEIGFDLIVSIKKVFVLYEKMSSITSNRHETLKLYGQFLIDILDDIDYGNVLIEKSKDHINNRLHLKLFKNDITDISADGSPVIIADIFENENLVISQMNSSVTRIFGYHKMELIGKNINCLLPKIFDEIHTECVNNYITSNIKSKTIVQKHISSFALHKSGYIFHVKFIMALLPNLHTECSFAIILKSKKNYRNYICDMIINSAYDILYLTSESMKIFNFTDKAFWNIKNISKIQSEDRINLKDYVPELLREKQKKSEEENEIAFEPVPIEKFLTDKDVPVHILDYEEVKENNNSNASNESYDMIMKKATFKSQISNKSERKNHNANALNSIMNIEEIKFCNKETNFYNVQFEYVFNTSINVQRIITPLSSSYINMTSIINSKTQPSPRLDFKFCEQKMIFYDIENKLYIVDKKEKVNKYRKFAISSDLKRKTSVKPKTNSPFIIETNNSLFKDNIINNDDSNNSSNAKGIDIKDSISSQSLYEEDVYNTLNFKNYSQNVTFYDLDKGTMTCSIFSKPIPKEGKRCVELKNFFEDDTLKAEDDITNIDNNNSYITKAKFEINKKFLFQEKYLQPKQTSVKIKSLSFIIFISHFIIATISLILYNEYINDTHKYIQSLSNISKVLNATLTSTGYFLDSLLIKELSSVPQDKKIEQSEVIDEIFKSNAKELYDVISITNKVLTKITKRIQNIKIDTENPLNVDMIYLKSIDDNFFIPQIDTRKYSYNEATYELMSSIYSLSLYYKDEIDLKDKEAFMVCYNTINEFFIKSIDYLKAIDKVVKHLVPKSTQIIILLTSIISNIIFFIFLFFCLREVIGQMNEILNEFLFIRQNEAYAIVRQCENFLKSIKIDLLDEDDEFNTDQEEVKEKKRSSKYIRSKMRKKNNTNFVIIGIISIVFIALMLYFIIQFFVIDAYNTRSEKFSSVFISVHYFLSNINLLPCGMKIIFFSNGTIPMLNKNLNQSIIEQLDTFLQLRNSLSDNLIHYSHSFANEYNEKIISYPITKYPNEALDYSLIPISDSYSIDSALADYYNNLNDFYFNLVTQNSKFEQLTDRDKIFTANRINIEIIAPYFKNVSDCLYENFDKATDMNRTFVLVWYAVCFIVEIVLFVFFWKPLEQRLQDESNKTRFLILLIPNKVLMNKKAILEILKNENMINAKK